MSLSLTHDVSNNPFAIIVDILSEQLEFVCPVRNHSLSHYEKAFDSIQFNPLFESLENQGVEAAYITLLRDIYTGATSTLKLHRDNDKIFNNI